MPVTGQDKQQRSKIIIAYILSGAVLPGLGQLYNRQIVKGAIISLFAFGLAIALVVNMYQMWITYFQMPGEYHAMIEWQQTYTKRWLITALNLGILLMIWLYALIDIYLYNKMRSST